MIRSHLASGCDRDNASDEPRDVDEGFDTSFTNTVYGK